MKTINKKLLNYAASNENLPDRTFLNIKRILEVEEGERLIERFRDYCCMWLLCGFLKIDYTLNIKNSELVKLLDNYEE